jgi:hypothetical protein
MVAMWYNSNRMKANSFLILFLCQTLGHSILTWIKSCSCHFFLTSLKRTFLLLNRFLPLTIVYMGSLDLSNQFQALGPKTIFAPYHSRVCFDYCEDYILKPNAQRTWFGISNWLHYWVKYYNSKHSPCSQEGSIIKTHK